jgi:hypothetical protein
MQLAQAHVDEISRTRFVDELGICGEVRVDVAVLNGSMTGYELKSERDTLMRLPKQVEFYSKVLDYCNLVVAENHVQAALEIIPKWWGYSVATEMGAGSVVIEAAREAEENLDQDPKALGLMLWRDELLSSLEALKLDRGYRSKSRVQLAVHLAECVGIEEIKNLVRMTLKSRQGWRSTPLSA